MLIEGPLTQKLVMVLVLGWKESWATGSRRDNATYSF